MADDTSEKVVLTKDALTQLITLAKQNSFDSDTFANDAGYFSVVTTVPLSMMLRAPSLDSDLDRYYYDIKISLPKATSNYNLTMIPTISGTTTMGLASYSRSDYSLITGVSLVGVSANTDDSGTATVRIYFKSKEYMSTTSSVAFVLLPSDNNTIVTWSPPYLTSSVSSSMYIAGYELYTIYCTADTPWSASWTLLKNIQKHNKLIIKIKLKNTNSGSITLPAYLQSVTEFYIADVYKNTCVELGTFIYGTDIVSFEALYNIENGSLTFYARTTSSSAITIEPAIIQIFAD